MDIDWTELLVDQLDGHWREQSRYDDDTTVRNGVLVWREVPPSAIRTTRSGRGGSSSWEQEDAMPQQRRPVVADSFESRFSAFLVQSDGGRVPFPAELRFDKADPFAVSLRLRTTDVRTVTWTFARQLLIDGARRPTGVGAVEVRPAFHDTSRIIVLSLKSASGRAQIHLPHEPVAAFLNDTYAAVPSGAESDLVDWNAELDRFRHRGR